MLTIQQQDELLKRVDALEKEVASRDEVISAKDKEIASLEYQLYWLRKKVHGRMSEKVLPLDPSALAEPSLFGDEMSEEERAAFEIAPLPEHPIYKSMASASLLADILVQKFFYHLPFYRVIQKYRELGVTISDSTINDWFAAVCEKLKLLYDRLRDEVMGSNYIQVDESTVPVIDNEKHRAVKGYMWDVLDCGTGMNFFHYDNGSRSKETARKLLCGYHGTLQCDGYEAYNQFEQMGMKVLACWAHVRRKYTEALEENRRLATEAIIYVRKLYQVESEADEQGLTPEQRCEKRKAEAYPVILEFEKWLVDTDRKVLNTSRMGRAIAYTYSLLPRLSLYVTDGRYNIDDNPIENTVRPLAVGRKNWLFCGNKAAAYRAAVVYSLISCCKTADVDPRTWLEDVLTRLPSYEKEGKDVSELLPHHWKGRFAQKSGM